jgi:hypothetical protein
LLRWRFAEHFGGDVNCQLSTADKIKAAKDLDSHQDTVMTNDTMRLTDRLEFQI